MQRIDAGHLGDRSSGFAAVDGTNLFYEIAGAGPPLILIHTDALDRRMWDEQVPAFAAHYRVIRYDLPGYGRSPRPDGRRAPGEDLYGLLRFLGIGRASVLGAGVGGAAALDLALEHSDTVRALILVASALPGNSPSPEVWQEMQERTGPLVDAFTARDATRLIEAMLNDPSFGPGPGQAESRRRVRAILEDTVPQVYLSPLTPMSTAMYSSPSAAERLGDLRIPTLILVGERDTLWAHEVAGTLTAGIAGSHLEAIPDAGNLVNLTQPETFNRLVLEFLVEQAPPAPSRV